MQPICSIVTPTYNRGYTLERLFHSLLKQSNNNFEWVIIDDGSTDKTEEIVKSFIYRANFEIIYLKKDNGGKHTALNMALDVVNGIYFFIVDSDDILPNKAVEIIFKWFGTIKNENDFAGIGGLKVNFNTEKNVGKTFDSNYIDCTSLERNKYSILGDKAEVFYTDVIKKYKFPVFENEKFLSEAIIWNQIAKDGYKIRWFNENIYYCEYRDDGLTHNLFSSYSKSPKGFALYLKSLIDNGQVNFIKKMYYYALYYSLTNRSIKQVCDIFKCSSMEIYIGLIIKNINQIRRG